MTLDMDSMTGTDLLVLAGTSLVAALAAGALWPRRWKAAALVVGLLFPAYTASSIAVGIMRGSKSNNLFPIAIAIACVLTFVPAFLGAGVGEMIGRGVRRLERSSHGGNGDENS